MKHIYTLFFIVSISFNINANPGNYYNSIDTNQNCTNLKTALFNLISSNYTQITYAQVKSAYQSTDMHKSDDGLRNIIWDMYSDNPAGAEPYEYLFTTVYPASAPNEGAGLNREHVFPQSWFDYASPNFDPPPKTDLFNVLPSDAYVNTYKSNFPLGKVRTSSPPTFTSLNGSKVGFADASIGFTNYLINNKVFEPRDEFKGDFARIYLYVVTRYEDSLINWNTYPTTAKDILDGNKYPGLDNWILKLCVSWSKLDPPSTKERNRNDSVFAIQGNRNPYVDFPSLAEKVFGIDGSGVCLPTAIRDNKSIEFLIYPNPSNDVINIRFANKLTGDNNAIISIVDVLGQTILQQSVLLNNGIETINVSNLSKGIYLINIIHDGQNNVTTFVKE